MPAFYLTTSQQSTPYLPSRFTPSQEDPSIESGVIALIIMGAIAFGGASLLGFKQYQRYRRQQQIKTLERLWQKAPHKRLH